MPTSEEILAGLSRISNDWALLAIGWHVYFGTLVATLISGLRLSRRLAGALLAIPLLSVSALAWTDGNPFNGTVFGVVALILGAVSLRLSPEPTRWGGSWPLIAGAVLFAFGWVYPHFLEAGTDWAYLYAAPTGLVPCPTLSVVIGLSLMLNGLDSRTWAFVLGAVGLAYGATGALRLGVLIDGVLLIGALALLAAGLLLIPLARRPTRPA